MIHPRTNTSFHGKVLLLAVVVHLITAWSSTGYYSADEHFQVVAFAQAKLGELPVEHLPWEYDTGIRSSLQPWIAVSVFRALEMVGITDPFNRTLMLRLLTALLALLAIRSFIRAALDQIPVGLQKPFILLSYFLWFLPFLHVRYSSEGWAAVFLLFGVGKLMRIGGREEDRRTCPAIAGGEETQSSAEKRMDPQADPRTVLAGRSLFSMLWVGMAFGIAVLCRPPVGLIVLCALLWLVFQAKGSMRELLLVVCGLGLVMLLGFGLDSAFYDRPLFSTFEYVRMGFTGDPDHRFDELPWYYYPPWVVKYAIPPIGVSILLALALLLWKRPTHPLVWCMVPFVVVHSFIPHKELRFLFPLADLMPLLLVLGLSELGPLFKSTGARVFGRSLIVVLVVSNILGLSVVMTSAAGIGRTVLAKKLHGMDLPEGSRIAYVIEPMQAWRISLPAFYLPKNMTDSAFAEDSFSGGELHTNYLVARNSDALLLEQRSGQHLAPLARTEVSWTEHLMRWYTWGEGPEPWTLYRVGPDRP